MITIRAVPKKIEGKKSTSTAPVIVRLKGQPIHHLSVSFELESFLRPRSLDIQDPPFRLLPANRLYSPLDVLIWVPG